MRRSLPDNGYCLCMRQNFVLSFIAPFRDDDDFLYSIPCTLLPSIFLAEVAEVVSSMILENTSGGLELPSRTMLTFFGLCNTP